MAEFTTTEVDDIPEEKPKGGRKKAAAKANGNGANLGFEAELWRAADTLRNNMDAAE